MTSTAYIVVCSSTNAFSVPNGIVSPFQSEKFHNLNGLDINWYKEALNIDYKKIKEGGIKSLTIHEQTNGKVYVLIQK